MEDRHCYGGSRGIGYTISEGSCNGVTVYITSRKADDCIQAASQLSEYGTCTAIPADLSKEESLAEFVAEFRTHESHLDLLVNNAGAAWGAPLGEFPSSGFDKVLNVNVKALYVDVLLPSGAAASQRTHQSHHDRVN